MTKKTEIIDFGAPNYFGAHVFKVEIPASKNGFVKIIEDFGYKGSINGIPQSEVRVILERRVWNAIADYAKKEFNERLKSLGLKTAKWHLGINLVEKLLGKELCVLAWAAEKASDEEIPIIIRKWLALRPEERWWLFLVTATEAGTANDFNRGWRKALYFALSDGDFSIYKKKKNRPVENDVSLLSLFPD
ncbi:MAG: anti-phage-associated DUF3780 domain-containing protein [Candidatus Pacearchaeota archaeon]